jgi:hypothetical protein
MNRWRVERTHVGCWIAYRQGELTGAMLFRTLRRAHAYATAGGQL